MTPSQKSLTVAITRPLSQAEELARLLTVHGWLPLVAPTVEISRTERSPALDEFMLGAESGSWDVCVFTSQNGVAHAFEEAERSGMEREFKERLSRCTVVAIGPKTAAAINGMGVRVDIVPRKHSSEGILDELARSSTRGGTAYILRSDIGGDALRLGLERTHERVEDIPVYASHVPSDTAAAAHLIREVLAGRVDAITFTSASAANNLLGIARSMGSDRELLGKLNKQVLVVVIGDVTMRALDRLGVAVDVTPSIFTIDDMVRALYDHIRSFGHAKRGGITEDRLPLDSIDRAIIDQMQYAFPICAHPFAEIASELGLEEQDVLRRVDLMLASSTVRRIGPVIDRKRLGFEESTLVAAKVPRERVPDAVAKINTRPEVSHNYEREHEYNIWFTVAGHDRREVEATVKEIMRDIGIGEGDFLELPSVGSYKIDARLRTV